MPIDICDLYDELPLSETTLLRRMHRGQYPMLRNDRGGACDYYIYEEGSDVPAGVVLYANNRKLVVHGIASAEPTPAMMPT